jgi:hypothetical protein
VLAIGDVHVSVTGAQFRLKVNLMYSVMVTGKESVPCPIVLANSTKENGKSASLRIVTRRVSHPRAPRAKTLDVRDDSILSEV